MGRLNLKAYLVSENDNFVIETTGIKSKNKILYKENNISVTIFILNNNLELIRECSEYKIKLVFKENCNTVSTYSVFGGSKTFDLSTYTKKLKITEEKIQIEYELEGNTFSYSLLIGG